MRFLLDTNILIPLEDSNQILEAQLANFVRLAHEHGHQLLYHPASEDDFNRDSDANRRKQTFDRLKQYTRLDDNPPCPWNTEKTSLNDAADNQILYALHCDAVHALVTEDRGIHDNAKRRGLLDRVYTIQTAEDWLLRLHEKIRIRLPNIEDKSLHALTPQLGSEFFNSLREGYPQFNEWFRKKAREGTNAWIAREEDDSLGAICIYARQDNETITEEGLKLTGKALKLCTFKVGASARGKKIGELLLKAAFRYATANKFDNIFIHGDSDQHHFLFEMLEDFGFIRVGSHPGSNGRDAVYLKHHPIVAPATTTPIEPFQYLKQFFPHYRKDSTIAKFIVPIRPDYHRILFPDYISPTDTQLSLFSASNYAGNAIKLAYLCHAQTKQIKPGDIILFYRSYDERAITSVGVVESYASLQDAGLIAGKVKRRTVYSMEEIQKMAKKPTKVMLFRLITHFHHPLQQAILENSGILKGAPQSIVKISDQAFEKILINGK